MKSILTRFSKNILPFCKTNKTISIIAILIIVTGGYISIKKIFSPTSTNQYILARVSKGDIETTITGTGQVSATNQIDIKAKVSGDITYIGATEGQYMKAGQIIAKVDTTDISLSLQSARISLAKLKKPAEQSSVISSQNSLTDAEEHQKH